MADRLATLLPADAGKEPILEIGCGTGIMTRRLLKAYPEAEVHALDFSGHMLAQAAAESPYGDVDWIEADIREYRPSGSYSLIVSSSSLHWIEPLDETCAALTALAELGCTFVASIMLYGTLSELHKARARVAPDKIPWGRLPELDELTAILKSLGWQIEDAQEERFNEQHRDAAAFLRSLHDRGVTGGSVSRADTPLTRGELRQLIEFYDANYHHPAGGVQAGYHVGLVRAVRS